jgi:hypothetical protein
MKIEVDLPADLARCRLPGALVARLQRTTDMKSALVATLVVFAITFPIVAKPLPRELKAVKNNQWSVCEVGDWAEYSIESDGESRSLKMVVSEKNANELVCREIQTLILNKRLQTIDGKQVVPLKDYSHVLNSESQLRLNDKSKVVATGTESIKVGDTTYNATWHRVQYPIDGVIGERTVWYSKEAPMSGIVRYVIGRSDSESKVAADWFGAVEEVSGKTLFKSVQKENAGSLYSPRFIWG